MRLATALLLVLLVSSARAQTPGSCAPGTAEGDLDVNDVFARVFNTGSLFFGNETTAGDGYLVPKTTGHSPVFASGLWIGGRVEGELRVAGARYTNFEYWPGPLDEGAALPNPSDCSAYDRIFVVSRADVARYLETGGATDDLRDWPAHLGAPVLDGDGDPGNYNLEGGDQPAIYGEQTAWWVMNDVGNVHEQTGTPPLGVEVQVTAFAALSTMLALNQTTFYRYRLVNRNTRAIDSTYVSFWWDTDLGVASDDWMGTDTTRALVFAYNAGEDPVYTGAPPAFGVRVLESPDGDDGVTLGLSTSMTLTNSAGPLADPITAEGFYHVMRGRWRDGTPVTATGNGYRTEGPAVPFMFPGDPVEEACWSAINNCEGESVPPANRRAVASMGPFRLEPGEAEEVVVALVFARGRSQDESHEAVAPLRVAADVARGAWAAGVLAPSRVEGGAPPGDPQAVELARPWPNPFADRLSLRYTLPLTMSIRVTLLDVRGREVATLASGAQPAGPQRVDLDTAHLPAGLYLVRFEAGTEVRAFPVVKAR